MPRAHRHSLRWRLSLALFAVVLLTGAVAGVLSFVWALHDANEILDGTLQDMADLIANRQMALPQRGAQLAGTEPENDVLVVPLSPRAGSAPSPFAALLAPLPEGLHTVRWQGNDWRVLVRDLPARERVAVAQRTEVRDEIAQHSAMRTLFPLLLLMPLLVLLVREVVRRTLAPVARLAQHVDSNPMAHAAHLPEVEVPQEIQPFVHSIKRLLGDMAATLAAQQRFLANAAHELRSPMAALQLQVANVEQVVHDSEASERLERLHRGIGRMQHLLEQLLAMAHAEAAASDVAPIAIADVAREVIADLLPQAAAKGIALGMNRCDADLRVRATALDLATLLHNLAGNAIQYCPRASVVTLSVYAENGEAVISVQDDGPGIPAEHRERVLEPFYRAPAASEESGSGLGLSIVATIAKRLGGRVGLAAGTAGRGLRVEYRQPVAA